jgi:hypothetical protein
MYCQLYLVAEIWNIKRRNRERGRGRNKTDLKTRRNKLINKNIKKKEISKVEVRLPLWLIN